MGILGSLRQWWSDHVAERAFYALNSQARGALARDNGLSEGDLERILARGSRGGQELPCLLRALTLDPAEIERRHPTLMRDMSITCSTCDAVKQCRRDLADGSASRAFKQYCPNAQEIDLLDRERWERRDKLIQEAIQMARRH